MMGLLGYILDRMRQRRHMLTTNDTTYQGSDDRDERDRRDADACLENRLREDVRRYEDDLRELART